MLTLLLLLAPLNPAVDRPLAVYRCPAAEAEGERFKDVVEEGEFDGVCIDPKPGPKALALLAGKLKVVPPREIDTDANLKWRNATIAFARGDISPAAWLEKTKRLKTTFHFLTSPKTKGLRDVMADIPIPPMGTFSGRSVFAELFALSWPGAPCFTATDVWKSRYLPEAGRLQSWILAMNDWLGPMLSMRREHLVLTKQNPKILRADKTPGLFVYRFTEGKKSWTFYVNNSKKPIKLPPVDMGRVTIHRGLNVDEGPPLLMDTGFLIEAPAE